jgi:hypothetical protein
VDVTLTRDRNKNTVKLIAMDVSDYNLETLRHDAEFVLYRGLAKRQKDKKPSRLLILAPVLERPAPETLRRMEHELCLKEELEISGSFETGQAKITNCPRYIREWIRREREQQ